MAYLEKRRWFILSLITYSIEHKFLHCLCQTENCQTVEFNDFNDIETFYLFIYGFILDGKNSASIDDQQT